MDCRVKPGNDRIGMRDKDVLLILRVLLGSPQNSVFQLHHSLEVTRRNPISERTIDLNSLSKFWLETASSFKGHMMTVHMSFAAFSIWLIH